MKKVKLKPCPFCGGEAEINTNSQVTCCWVECTECNSRTRCFEEDVGYCAMDSAAMVWNQRAGGVKSGAKMDEEVENDL